MMAKLILSTSNIMNGVPSIVRKPTIQKSSTELTTSLRANFVAAQEIASEEQEAQRPLTNGDVPTVNGTSAKTNGHVVRHPSLPLKSWTTRQDGVLYIPSIDWSDSGLAEERSQYDITVKLFYLPGICPARRALHTKEALALLMKELRISSIDLLIVSFPGVTFDGDSEGQKITHQNGCGGYSNGDYNTNGEVRVEVESTEVMVQTWRILEDLHARGTIGKLGVCEFGSKRLKDLLPHTRVRPLVDQINVRDCCVVPRPLINFAKQEGIELLTHNDCTDILPRGTVRELLGSGEKGAGLLQENGHVGQEETLAGEVVPQWVVKYTAVVKDRGVVENKGYFAGVELE